jgi:hypothetical protein
MRLGLKKALMVVVASAGGQAVAHHSFIAVFDPEQPLELTGTVTEIEWMNPHVWFYIDVETEEGATENWGLELGSPNGLIRRGWNHNSLQIGNVVNVVGVSFSAPLPPPWRLLCRTAVRWAPFSAPR